MTQTVACSWKESCKEIHKEYTHKYNDFTECNSFLMDSNFEIGLTFHCCHMTLLFIYLCLFIFFTNSAIVMAQMERIMQRKKQSTCSDIYSVTQIYTLIF